MGLNAAQIIIKGLFIVGMGINPAFMSEVTDVLEEKGIDYEIVKEIPGHPNWDAMYRFSDGKIFFDEDGIGNSGYLLRYIAAHEVIHKVRYENGLWTGDAIMEEAIAVYGAERAMKILGIPKAKVSEKHAYRGLLKSNGWEVKDLTEEELLIIENELAKTFPLLEKL